MESELLYDQGRWTYIDRGRVDRPRFITGTLVPPPGLRTMTRRNHRGGGSSRRARSQSPHYGRCKGDDLPAPSPPGGIRPVRFFQAPD